MSELSVAWSGSLERAGAAPGLSSYQGRSQLVGAFEREEAIPPAHAWRQVPGRKVKPGSLDEEVRELLRRGWTPTQIACRLQCSPNVAYRVRKQGA